MNNVCALTAPTSDKNIEGESQSLQQHRPVLQPSVTKKMVADAKVLSSQIAALKDDQSSLDMTFPKEEIANVKVISLELHQYCCDLEKMLKNQSFTQNVNSNSQLQVKSKKWVCKICKKSYIAMNLLTQHTLSVHEKQCFPCTFENCKKTFGHLMVSKFI